MKKNLSVFLFLFFLSNLMFGQIYFQDFAGGYLGTSGWTESSGILVSPTTLTGTTSNWNEDGFANVGSTGCAKLNIYGTIRKDWAFTPTITLAPGNVYNLKFDLALTVFAGTGAATLGEDDKFVVVISTDNGVTWSSANVLQTWTSATPISNTSEEVIIPLTGYTGDIKIGFYGESTLSNVDNDLFIDNISVNQVVADDAAITAIVSPVTGLTGNYDLIATLKNNGTNPITACNISYDVNGTLGFYNLTGANIAPNASLNITLATNYNFSTPGNYIINVTSNLTGDLVPTNDLKSVTVNLYSPLTVPFTEDFESVTTPGFSPLWTKTGDWVTAGTSQTYNRAPYSGTKYAYTSFSADDWLFTPPVVLEAGQLYKFSVWYVTDGYTDWTVEVKYGSAANSAGMTNVISTMTPSNTAFQELLQTFTAPSAGIYYFGIHITAPYAPYYITFDDISVTPVVPLDAGITAITSPVNGIVGNYDVIATIKNFGTENITSCSINYDINGTLGIYNLTGVDIAPNATLDVTIAAGYNFPTGGNTVITVTSNLTGDMISANNSKTKTVTFYEPYIIPYFDGFETGNTQLTAPFNWFQEAVSGTGIWTSNTSLTTFNRTPKTDLWNVFLGTNNNRWLFSREVMLTAGTEYSFSLFARQDGTTAANAQITVAYGTTKTAVGMTNTIIAQTGVINGDYQELIGSFIAAETGLYYFGINGVTLSNYISVDDIRISKIVSNDASIVAVTSPVNGVTGNYDVVVTIKNYGLNTITTCPIDYNINGNTGTYNLTGVSIPTNTTLDVAILTAYNFTVAGDYIITVTSALPADLNTDNNAKTVNVNLYPPIIPPYFEGFETGNTHATAVAGWTQEAVITNFSDSYVWSANNTFTDYNRTPRTGAWNAYLHYSSERWLFTKEVLLEAGISYRFKMYARQDMSTASYANVTVAYGTNNNSAAMTTNIVPQTSIINGNYQEISGVITPTTSGIYFVGIKGYMNSTPWYISIDDISIDPIQPNDAGITAIISPVTGLIIGSYDVIATIKNYGTETITACAINYDINGVTGTYNLSGENIPMDGTANVTILSGYSFPTAGDYVITVTSNLAGDLATDNNSITSTVNFYAPYTIPYNEGFETGNTQATVPVKWTQEAVTGTGNWTANSTLTNYNRTPRTGLWNVFLGTNNSRWMFSREVQLNAGTSYRLTMYARQDGSTVTNAKLTVSYGSTQNAVGMVNNIVPQTGVINGDYQELTGIFTPSETGLYFIGIKGETLSNYISVDDIEITAVADKDAGITAITSPVGGTIIGNYNVNATIKNFGTTPITSCAINYDINGTTGTYNLTGVSIALNEVLNITILSNYSFPSGGNYNITVTSALTGDLATSNDSKTITVNFYEPLTAPFFEGFETGNTDQTAVFDWTQEAVTGTSVWTANSSLATYNRAPRTGAFNSYLKFGNARWMFTREFSLIAGTTYEFTVYTRQDGVNTTDAKVTIACGSAKNAAAMTNIIVAETGITNGAYQQLFGTFTPTTSGYYFIGIKGDINSTPYYLSIDDISVEAQGLPPVAGTLTLTSQLLGAVTTEPDNNIYNITDELASCDVLESMQIEIIDEDINPALTFNIYKNTSVIGIMEHVSGNIWDFNFVEGIEWSVGVNTFNTTFIDGDFNQLLINVNLIYYMCDPTFSVTFNIDMNAAITNGDFNIANDVYMSGGDNLDGGIGNYERWALPGSNPDFKMTDPDENRIYSVTLNEVPAGAYQYLYFWIVPGNPSTSNQFPEVNLSFTIVDQDVIINDVWGFSSIISTESNINVYPNPSHGIFNFDINEQYQTKVYDISGKMVYSSTIDNANNSIDLSSQTRGMYFIQLIGKETFNFKIILK